MKTIITAIFSFFVCCQASLSQSIYDDVVNFLSLEGKQVSVKYGYDPKYDRTIFELNPHETLCFQDTRGVNSAKVHQKKFVELLFPMPGGSGEAVYKFGIICVSNDKLYKSIDVVSLIKDTNTEISSYELNFTGPIEKNGSFELLVGGSILHFDLDKKIFFDGYYTLNGSYYVNTDKDPVRKEKVFHNEKYPTLFLDHIFIENKWYILNNNYLTELTSICN